ncbi:MAG: tRNA pseudouridine(38-40) synthase TruA [Desulfobulbaceae bacterium]|nr:tRNA pseudouridine(38-40) synthase TruA [Desulfobulbaceae bacterium]
MNGRNIRLLTAFDGSLYSGWQRQENAPTIQGALEKCLQVMLATDITLHGAGRTDAGVHALGMVANFQTTSTIPCSGLLRGLNSMLPRDIRILEVDEAPLDFHSRYSATGKSYRYDIFTGEIQLPTERLYCAHYPGSHDSSRITDCLARIRGSHDFSSFEGSGSRDTSRENSRGAVRTLFHASSTEKSEKLSFFFTGDGFLRHMVRNLVGTLMEVGRGKITPEEFQQILVLRDRAAAGPTAPARGLFLERVFYEQIP